MPNRARDFVAKFFTDTTRFSTDPVTRELDDVGDASTKAARATTQSFDKIKRKVADTGHDVGHAGKETFGEAGKEVGAEFAQNVGQGLASGDISKIAQDSAGGLVAAFTAIGGPLGLALAGVAVGATTLFAKITADAQKMSEDVAGIFEEMQSGAERDARQRSALIAEFGGTFPEAMAKASGLAARAGIPLKEFVDSLLDPSKAKAMEAQLRNVQRAGESVTTAVGGKAGASVVKTYTDSAAAAKELADHDHDRQVSLGLAVDAMRTYNELQQDAIGLAAQLGGNVKQVAANLSTARSQLGGAFEPTVTGGLRR